MDIWLEELKTKFPECVDIIESQNNSYLSDVSNNETAYLSHLSELCERKTADDDLNKPTSIELMYALSKMSLEAPLSTVEFNLYKKLFVNLYNTSTSDIGLTDIVLATDAEIEQAITSIEKWLHKHLEVKVLKRNFE